MNKEKAKNLILTSERTIKIIKLLLAGETDGAIMAKVGCERQLANYYRKQLNDNLNPPQTTN